MNHSTDKLIEVVYRYYPQRLVYDDFYKETEEYRRLVAARRQAGAEREPWRALLRRTDEQFPEGMVQNGSLHLPTGQYDAGYSGKIFLPGGPSKYGHTVGFLISFLVPYYIIYSTRTVEDVEQKPPPGPYKTIAFYHRDTMYIVPNRWWTRLLGGAAEELIRLVESRSDVPDAPDQLGDKDRESLPPLRREVHLDLSPEEQTYATWLAQEIEATWGYERMPPEVGNVIVPDVATNSRPLGEARLYDCLFSDDW